MTAGKAASSRAQRSDLAEITSCTAARNDRVRRHCAPGAIAREKQIKAGSRRKRIDLINRLNPEWRDLYEEL